MPCSPHKGPKRGMATVPSTQQSSAEAVGAALACGGQRNGTAWETPPPLTRSGRGAVVVGIASGRLEGPKGPKQITWGWASNGRVALSALGSGCACPTAVIAFCPSAQHAALLRAPWDCASLCPLPRCSLVLRALQGYAHILGSGHSLPEVLGGGGGRGAPLPTPPPVPARKTQCSGATFRRAFSLKNIEPHRITTFRPKRSGTFRQFR